MAAPAITGVLHLASGNPDPANTITVPTTGGTAIADGALMIAVYNLITSGGQTPLAPSRGTWTTLYQDLAVGTRGVSVKAHIRNAATDGGNDYRFDLSANGEYALSLFWINDWSGSLSDLILGTAYKRGGTGSVTNTLNSITTTKADTLAVALSTETTTAAESGSFLTGPTWPSGWTQFDYIPQGFVGSIIETIALGTKPMPTPGSTGSATITYQNSQPSNGWAAVVGVPPVVASNVAPTAGFTYVAEDLAVQFTDTSTDSDGTISSRAWNFGDGSTSTATNPQHTFDGPGTYTVSLQVTDNNGATNTTNQSITVAGISAFEWEVARGTWKEAIIQIRSTGNTDQRIQQADYVMGQGASLTQQLTWYAQGKKMFVAHRGLSQNYPEETAYAYWAACVLGYQALEISVQKSASGTFWCFHDATTDRTTGVSGTIASMTDAQLSVLSNNPVGTDNQSQPARPVAKLTDLLAIYGGKRLIFIEDKTYTNTAAVLDLMDANGGTDWFVWKQAGTGNIFSAVNTRGYKSWGYFFDADMASTFASKQAQWTFVGLDYNSSDATLDSAIATAGASRVIGHIVSSTTNRDRFLTRGVRGLMVSNAHNVTPVVS